MAGLGWSPEPFVFGIRTPLRMTGTADMVVSFVLARGSELPHQLSVSAVCFQTELRIDRARGWSTGCFGMHCDVPGRSNARVPRVDPAFILHAAHQGIGHRREV